MKIKRFDEFKQFESSEYQDFDKIFNSIKDKLPEIGTEVIKDLAGDREKISNWTQYDENIGDIEHDDGIGEQKFYFIYRFTYDYNGTLLPLELYVEGKIFHRGYSEDPGDYWTPPSADYSYRDAEAEVFIIGFDTDVTKYDDELYSPDLDNIDTELEEKIILDIVE